MKTLPLASVVVLLLASPALADHVADLVEQLRSGAPLEREVAAVDLGDLGERAAPAVPALQAALQDEIGHVRMAAVVALLELGEIARSTGPELLRYTLAAEDSTERSLGWQALSSTQLPDVLAGWVEGSQLRPADLVALVEMLGERSLPYLTRAVNSDDPAWRRAGAECVPDLPEADGVIVEREALVSGLDLGGPEPDGDEPDEEGELELDPQLTPDEQQALPEAELAPAGGGFAFEGGGGGGVLSFEDNVSELAWTLPDPLVQGLIAMLQRDEDERWRALEALQAMGSQAKPAAAALVRGLSSDWVEGALDVLYQLSSAVPGSLVPAKAGLLEVLRDHEDSEIRETAAELLINLPGAEVTEALLSVLTADSPSLRAAAVDSLVHGERDADETIARALIALLEREGLPPPPPEQGMFTFTGGNNPRESAGSGLEMIARRNPQIVAELAQAVKREGLHEALGVILERASR